MNRPIRIEAKSESEVSQYFQDIDILLLGPHYASLKPELAAQAKPLTLLSMSFLKIFTEILTANDS